MADSNCWQLISIGRLVRVFMTGYCAHIKLKELPIDSSTQEDQELMRTMAEIDVWFEASIENAKHEAYLRAYENAYLEAKRKGKLEVAKKVIEVKFVRYVLTEEVNSQLESLNEQQYDDFIVRIMNWQQPDIMEEWLDQVVDFNRGLVD
jgi:hypothetical protein